MFDTVKSGVSLNDQQILSILNAKKYIKMALRIKIKAYLSFLLPKIPFLIAKILQIRNIMYTRFYRF